MSLYIRRGLKVVKWIILTPVILFVVLCVLLYVPPVQHWAVNEACDKVNESTGYQVSIENVRLKFPLDLVLGGVKAIDNEGDTLIDCKSLCLDVPLLPLLDGRVDVDGLELRSAAVNTKSLISDTHVEGRVGRASVSLHGYDWSENYLSKINAEVADADVYVCLTDTAPTDTTPSAPIMIDLDMARIANTKVRVVLPGDTVSIDAVVKRMAADGGHFDTGKNEYLLKNLDLSTAHLRYANWNIPALNLLLDEFGFADDCIKASASVTTALSDLEAGVSLPLSAFDAGSEAELSAWVKGKAHPNDIWRVCQSFLSESDLQLPKDRCLNLDVAATGNMDDLVVDHCHLALPLIVSIDVSGKVGDLLSEQPKGDLNLRVQTEHSVNALVQQFAGSAVTVPMGSVLHGKLAFQGFAKYIADLHLNAAGGGADMKGEIDLDAERYKLAVGTRSLPIKAFIRDLNATPLTAALELEGRGFDIENPLTRTDIRGRIEEFKFADFPLDNTRLEVLLQDAHANIGFDMRNQLLQGEGRLLADVQNGYTATIEACVDAFNPYEASLMEDSLTVGANFIATACVSEDLSNIESSGYIDQISFVTPDTVAKARDLDYDLLMMHDSIYAKVSSGDLDLAFTSSVSINEIVEDGARFVDELISEVRQRKMDQATLSRLLPNVRLTLNAGTENPLAAILRAYDYSMTSLRLVVDAEPNKGINGELEMGRFTINKLKLDTIYADLMQDSTGLKMLAHVDNYRKDNRNKFTATFDAYALASGVGADIVFKDEQQRKGIDLGVLANLDEAGVKISLYPRNPILAYRTFTLNEDNFVRLGNDNTIRANIDLLADDGTGLKLYGNPTPDGNNDISLSINRFNLGELSNVLMFLPKMKGYLSGDIHLADGESRTAMASLKVNGFKYEDIAIGNVGSEITYLPKADGEHYAEATLELDEEEILQAKGSYFEGGKGRFVGDVAMTELPLRLADMFLLDLEAGMTGRANANMHAEGPMDELVLNGLLHFSDAHLQSKVYGLDFALDPRPVEIKESKLHFDNYALRSSGNSALEITGDINAQNMQDILVNLDMEAKNFELINSKRSKESMLFGKVITDFVGEVKGSLSSLRVNGELEINNRTDVTFVLRDTPVSAGDEFKGLVTFLDFQDTTYVEPEPAPPTNIEMKIGVDVNEGAKLRCLLSEDGRSYVNLTGGGNLMLRYNYADGMRLMGRYTIEDGSMKYELPIIPLKTLKIARGSYAEFTGDIGNPLLSIKATEIMRSTVSVAGVQRPVNFEVGVDISQQLSNMGVEFTIDAPEDTELRNTLLTMTQAQRNKTAVAMMATGMYISDDESMTEGLSGTNALNVFLASSITSIAGNARNTVDINFDINDRVEESGAGATDYNFAFSKRFWGDRVNVVIGGKVSAGPEAVNTAASIIDNISIEYRLDRGSTRYIRAFYNRTSHDVLDGNLMKTGVGLVLRRKTNRLGELFLFKK